MLGCGLSADCTGNGIPDECEADCNSNTTADRCELLNGTAGDCNRNGIPDECDPGGGIDCNSNQTPDFCDIFLETSDDHNQNGIPDECEPHRGTIYVDDDAPDDPGPGDPTISDPAEDGTMGHPFDAIEEAIDVSLSSDVIVMADGTYTGEGNRNLSYGGRVITVRSENGPENCVIDLEYAAGGFYFEGGESLDARLEGLTITNAIGGPSYYSAAIYVGNGSPTVFNCVLSGCTARAIAVLGISRPAIDRCRITDNVAVGVYCGTGRPTLDNSLFANNGSAGVYSFYGNVAVSNCTFTGNSQGVTAGGSNVTVRNSVIWGNTYAVVGSPDISYSNVEGGSAGIGNIDADPLFVDPEGHNYRLASSSPSIDAGENMSSCTAIDLDGNPRFLDDPDSADTGSGVPPIVDMGAYEFVPDDCNDNGTPDAEEILADPNLDSNGNGVLDECEASFTDCNANGRPDFCEPDCNATGIPDDCDIADNTSDDCNTNGIPDECDIADGTSRDCNVNEIPDDCEPDADTDGVPDVCDVCAGFDDLADCDEDSTPDGCEISVGDGGLCTGEECSSDCNANAIPDECDMGHCVGIPGCEDCQPNGVPDECDIAGGGSLDANFNGIPDECSEDFNPPVLPTVPKHRVLKHRYLSVDPSESARTSMAIKVEVAEMRRCQNAPTRACLTNSDCDDVCDDALSPLPHHTLKCPPAVCSTTVPPSVCVASGPCVDLAPTFDPPLAWVVQQPIQDPTGGCKSPGCPPYPPGQDNCCQDDDWMAYLGDTVPALTGGYTSWSEVWADIPAGVLHIAGCPVVPAVTYGVYACDPNNLDQCSAPLMVSTAKFPVNARPTAFPLYTDVCGGTQLPGPTVLPPDGYVSVKDLQCENLTIINYGGLRLPQMHPTWADLHGSGTGIPPNYNLSVADLMAVYVFSLTDSKPYVNTQGGLDPQDCP